MYSAISLTTSSASRNIAEYMVRSRGQAHTMHATTAQAAQALGCSADTVRKLIHAGLMPGVEQRGVRAVLPVSVVQALAGRPHAPLDRLVASGLAKSSRIAVLRPGVAEPVQEPDRKWMGFSTSLPPGDLLQGLRGWWKCNPGNVKASGLLPVTLGSFVVAVLIGLQTWETAPDSDGVTRHRFAASFHMRLHPRPRQPCQRGPSCRRRGEPGRCTPAGHPARLLVRRSYRLCRSECP